MGKGVLEIELSREEILRRVEIGAQRRRGMSAVELIRRYRTRALEDSCEMLDVLSLVDLLDDDDPGITYGVQPTPTTCGLCGAPRTCCGGAKSKTP